MNPTSRTRVAAVLAAGVLALGASSAAATEYGPEWDPQPDQTSFQPEPDLSTFEPGAAPGTADLVDDNLARVLRGVLGGLLG